MSGYGAAPAVVWSVVRKNHAGLRVDKSTRTALSNDAGNSYNIHSSRYSGYSKSHAIDVSAARSAKRGVRGVRVGFKTRNLRVPTKTFTNQVTTRDARHVLRSLKNAGAHYKKSQTYGATARFSKLNRANNLARRAAALKKRAEKSQTTSTEGQQVN